MSHVGKALIDPYAIFEKIGLAEGMRVADLGCGRTGHIVFTAARQVGEKGIVYAVDVMKDVLENISSRCRGEGHENVQVIWSDIELLGKTPVPKESLDVCFFVNVLSMVKDKLSALKEAARLLKEGGVIVVVDWAKKLGLLGPDQSRQVNPQMIEQTAKEAGLKLKDTFVAGDYHFCAVLEKNI